MARRTVLVFAVVMVGAIVFVAGVATYPLLFPASKGQTSEGLSLGGYFYIEAHHADGQSFASWQGHNTLTPNGVSGLSQCLSGQNLPAVFGSCSGVTAYVYVSDGGSGLWTGAVTNTLYPSGCNPNANPGTCTGWQAKGVIQFNSGTLPDTVGIAGTEGSDSAAIDAVNISPISVSMGDYLTVTVVFTIS